MFVALACCLLWAAPIQADNGTHKFTLVIDAGHGGHDAGAVGAT